MITCTIFVFQLHKASLSFKFKNSDKILEFTYLDLLLVILAKLYPQEYWQTESAFKTQLQCILLAIQP